MVANSAKYGIATVHFYWVGAIPAMVFLGIFMMPFYYGSRVRTVPEYLKLRYNEATRGLNAISFAIMTVLMSGISLYAMALLFKIMLGWPFTRMHPLRRRRRPPLRLLGRSVVLDLQRGHPVLPHLARPPADRLPRAQASRRLRRARGQAPGDAAPLHQVSRHEQQPARRRLVRRGHGPRLRPVLRLLDDRFPGRPAGPGLEEHQLGPHDPDHRRLPEDARPHHRRHPRPRRPARPARVQPGRPSHGRLQLGPHPAHEALPAQRPPGPGHHGPARELHVGHGRQRHGLQHHLDLRHLRHLHQEGPARRPLPEGRQVRHGHRDPRLGRDGLHRPSASRT